MRAHYHVVYPNNDTECREISDGVHRTHKGATKRMLAEAEALRRLWGYSYAWSLAIPDSIVIGRRDSFGDHVNRMELVSCDMPFAHCSR